MGKHKPLLREKYEKEVAPALKKELGVKNDMAIPKVTKVVVNMGIGKLHKEKEMLKKASEDLAAITGQTPSARPAKVSVAGFNVREGALVGYKITLRGDRMYDFLTRLFSIVLPRLRDFRGLSLASFDEGGNYSLGITEHTVFPEIDLGKSPPRGIEITIVTNTKKKDEAEKLLSLLGMPFEKEEENG